jgi:sulfite exporter TauE/SafE
MDATTLATLFFLGLSGTGHCIGMCGPLVFAFPGKTGKLSAHLCYHAGRLTTYTMVGIGLGSIGLAVAKLSVAAGFDYLTTITRIQVLFSLLAGAFLLIFGLGQLGLTRQPALITVATPDKIPGYRYLVRSAFLKSNPALMALTGLFMGFLPCGLSYAAFSKALTASRPMEGGALLLAFGIGTLPGLLLVGTGASVLSRRYRQHFDIFSGILMIAMAVSLLVDGLTAIV